MPECDYTIEFQNQTRGLIAGQLVDLYEIHYAGPAGVTGWVRVPVRTATPQLVDSLIRQQLDDQLRIAQLGQPQG